MGFIELSLLALAVSMDAFAVAVCLGLNMKKATLEKAFFVGLYFGIFQALMPLIGYFAASIFADKITAIDHWIAFILLGFLGSKMIIGSFKKEKCKTQEPSLKPSKMIPYAIATSIDALAIGISFAFLSVKIVPAIALIGVITLILSFVGVKLGGIFGLKLKSKAEIAGGIILILIGIKIFLNHLGVIGF